MTGFFYSYAYEIDQKSTSRIFGFWANSEILIINDSDQPDILKLPHPVFPSVIE